MKHILLIAAITVAGFTSCKKNNDNPYNPNVNGELSVEFDNIAGSADLQLNTGNYINSSGESLSITKLKYYVSNFVLTNTDGTVYTIPQDSSYFLIEEGNEAAEMATLHVPEGAYKTLQFIVGIDSLRSTMDVSERTGVLDPAGAGADMYWDLNSGYIFFKMEGTSAASPTGDFMYHIGGYGGYSSPTINNIKHISFDLTKRGMPQVKDGKETNIHVMVDALKLFNDVSIAAHSMVMFDPFSTTMADNFNAMFAHDHTEN